MGAVFMHDIEQVLGGGLAQPCEAHVYGAGQLAFGAACAADGTMTPIEAEEFIPFEDWAAVATWRVYTGQNATVVESLVTEDGGVPSPIDAELTVAPQHGTVEIGGTSFGYTPEKDSLGTDTFTVVMTANGVTRTVEFTVEVLDLPGDSTPTPIDPAPAPPSRSPSPPRRSRSILPPPPRSPPRHPRSPPSQPSRSSTRTSPPPRLPSNRPRTATPSRTRSRPATAPRGAWPPSAPWPPAFWCACAAPSAWPEPAPRRPGRTRVPAASAVPNGRRAGLRPERMRPCRRRTRPGRPGPMHTRGEPG